MKRVYHITIFLCILETCTPIEKCNVECDNYLSLKADNIDIFIKNETVSAEIARYPPVLSVRILSRRLYKDVSDTGRSGLLSVDYYDGPMLPDLTEAREWVDKNKCKIGSLCKPDGDCYGGGLDHCNGFGLNPTWVTDRQFQYRNVQWHPSMMFLKRYCVQDWDCYIKKHESVVYLHDDGTPFIRPGEQVMNLTGSKYFKESDFSVFIEREVEATKQEKKIDCLIDKDNYYCQYTDGDKVINVHFDHKTDCSNYQNYRICIHKSNYALLSDKIDVSRASTVDDVMTLKEQLNSLIIKQDYNNMLLQKEISELKNILNKIIISSSRYNPFVLKDILALNVHVRKYGNLLRACPCADLDNDCVLNSKVKNGDSNCEGKESRKTIDILKLENIDKILPADIDFRGREETVYENEDERDRGNREEFKYSGGDSWNGFGPFSFNLPLFGIFSGLASYLTYINLVILLYLLCCRRV